MMESSRKGDDALTILSEFHVEDVNVEGQGIDIGGVKCCNPGQLDIH